MLTFRVQAETAQTWQDMDHIKLFEFLGRIVGKVCPFSCSSLFLSSLELSDTKVYSP